HRIRSLGPQYDGRRDGDADYSQRRVAELIAIIPQAIIVVLSSLRLYPTGDSIIGTLPTRRARTLAEALARPCGTPCHLGGQRARSQPKCRATGPAILSSAVRRWVV